MDKLMKYKDYIGTAEYSKSDKIFYGKVVNIAGLVSYEGNCLEKLQTDFEEAVDDYLEMCGKQPL